MRDAELKLAEQLVDQISSETFEPTKYEDEVKTRVLADIQRKVEGQEIEAPERRRRPAQVIDLMEALKASLEASGRGAARPSRALRRSANRRPAQRAARATKRRASQPAGRSRRAPARRSPSAPARQALRRPDQPRPFWRGPMLSADELSGR